MRKIVAWEISTIEDFKDVIHLSQIIELEIRGKVKNEEDLRIFTNLRKLFTGYRRVDCKKCLPEMRNLNYLSISIDNME